MKAPHFRPPDRPYLPNLPPPDSAMRRVVVCLMHQQDRDRGEQKLSYHSRDFLSRAEAFSGDRFQHVVAIHLSGL